MLDEPSRITRFRSGILHSVLFYIATTFSNRLNLSIPLRSNFATPGKKKRSRAMIDGACFASLRAESDPKEPFGDAGQHDATSNLYADEGRWSTGWLRNCEPVYSGSGGLSAAARVCTGLFSLPGCFAARYCMRLGRRQRPRNHFFPPLPQHDVRGKREDAAEGL